VRDGIALAEAMTASVWGATSRLRALPALTEARSARAGAGAAFARAEIASTGYTLASAWATAARIGANVARAEAVIAFARSFPAGTDVGIYGLPSQPATAARVRGSFSTPSWLAPGTITTFPALYGRIAAS
jgi:hypothetical protein